MADIISRANRSALMSRIGRSGTKPEMFVRKGLHRDGFRFRADCRTLPGSPDLVFARYRATILVHGCFWHGHDCHLFRLPGTRPEFWSAKISRNRERDVEVVKALSDQGFRTLVIWECALRGRSPAEAESVIVRAGKWLKAGSGNATIRGPRDSRAAGKTRRGKRSLR